MKNIISAIGVLFLTIGVKAAGVLINGNQINPGTAISISTLTVTGSSGLSVHGPSLLSGFVGIGAANVGDALDVAGNIGINLQNGSTSYFYQPNFGSNYSGEMIFQAGDGSAAAGGGILLGGQVNGSRPGSVVAGIGSGSGGRFSVNTSGIGTGNDIFTVLSNGNAGIGSTNPQSPAGFAPVFVSSGTNGAVQITATGGVSWDWGGLTSGVELYNEGTGVRPIIVSNAGDVSFSGAISVLNSSVTASAFFGDGSHITNIGGFAALASTQTFSGINTFAGATSFTGAVSGVTIASTTASAISASGSNTTFGICVATLTITTSGGKVAIFYSGTMNGSANTETFLTVLEDGAFIPPWTSSSGMAATQNADGIMNMPFFIIARAPASGIHHYCLAPKISGTSWSFSTDTISQFGVYQVQ